MLTIHDLPKPDADRLKQSAALTHEIQQSIEKEGGAISFAKYMELALYHPTLGYYNAIPFTIGAQGDFTTAPLISPLFARCLGKQVLQITEHLGSKQIVELGAGTGHLAKDILFYLNERGHLPDHYFIYEISPGLRKKQYDFFSTACPSFLSRIKWLDHLPTDFTGIIIANEVLDALPTHLFHLDNDHIWERSVIWREPHFEFKDTRPASVDISEYVKKIKALYSLPDGYQSEVNLLLPPFIQQIAANLNTGVILFADYGYGEEELYHPERTRGTLTCFYRHLKHENAFIYPGLQDITAHVNFTTVIENAAGEGCSLAGYTTQAAFLLACGLMDFAAEASLDLPYVEEFQLNQAIKILTLPTEMGERIKMMALAKNINIPLLGFTLQDRRREL